jgi:hypothetical protein
MELETSILDHGALVASSISPPHRRHLFHADLACDSPYIRLKAGADMNWRIFWMSQIFWLIETWHFGWNFLPSSDAEMVCDGIVVLLLALSIMGYRAKPTGDQNEKQR